jgi:hypothetical protein
MLDVRLVDIVVATESIGNLAHQRFARAQLGFQRAVDFSAEPDPRNHRFVTGKRNGVEQFLIKRIGDGHRDLIIISRESDQMIFLEKADRDGVR